MLIRDRLPAYITWDRFQANRARLAANRARYEAQGPPRAGAALLNGLLRCGRCGRRLQVRYGAKGYHWYGCTRGMSDYGEPLCQSLSGRLLDQAVGEQLLSAVEPAALEASLLAVADVERERAALARHRQLRLERARYEADRAERQYWACEPENRLVGRALEARWEAALQQARQLDDEYERWQRAAPARVSDADRDAIRALAQDLPTVWRAAATGPADRQRIARLLLEEVRVTVDRSSERVDIDLVWAGRHTSRQAVLRPVARYDRQADYPRLVARLRDLCARKRSSAEIAEALNAEGYRPPKRTRQFTGAMVLRLTAHLGLARRERDRAGGERVSADATGPPAGRQPRHGARMGPPRVGDDPVGRGRAPRHLGRRRRVAPAAATPRGPAVLGEQAAAGGTPAAEAPPGT